MFVYCQGSYQTGLTCVEFWIVQACGDENTLPNSAMPQVGQRLGCLRREASARLCSAVLAQLNYALALEENSLRSSSWSNLAPRIQGVVGEHGHQRPLPSKPSPQHRHCLAPKDVCCLSRPEYSWSLSQYPSSKWELMRKKTSQRPSTTCCACAQRTRRTLPKDSRALNLTHHSTCSSKMSGSVWTAPAATKRERTSSEVLGWSGQNRLARLSF